MAKTADAASRDASRLHRLPSSRGPQASAARLRRKAAVAAADGVRRPKKKRSAGRPAAPRQEAPQPARRINCSEGRQGRAAAVRQGGQPAQVDEAGEVRRDGRGPHVARHRHRRRATRLVRGSGAAAARHRQDGPRRGLLPGRQRRQGEGGRRRLRRQRRPDREDPEGELARLRRGPGHAGHDGQGQPARQGARPARPDADAQGRHRDPAAATSPRPSGSSRPARSSTAPTRAATSTPASAR